MNTDLPVQFSVTPKENYKRRFQQTGCMINFSIQNVLFNEIKWRKIKDDANQVASFQKGHLDKEKIELDVMTMIEI